MFAKNFTSYKEVAMKTSELLQFAIKTESLTPVLDYLKAHDITDNNDIVKYCKIARAIGMKVSVVDGEWRERGIRIINR